MNNSAHIPTEAERYMAHFNANVKGCRAKRESGPCITYIYGCYFITCEPTDCHGEPIKPTTWETRCPCTMNMEDGGSVPELITQWTKNHGR